MSGSGWALVILGAGGVLALGGLLVGLLISVRRERAAGHQAEHARRRRGREGDRR